MSPSYSLTVSPVPDQVPTSADSTFYWAKAGSTGWFSSTVGPGLGEFGLVNDRNIDLVRIASAVLAADRSASRSGRLSRWNTREISVTVDVIAVKPWRAVQGDLEALLGFLTGDTWHLDFKRGRGQGEQLAARATGVSRVVLFSGGADSAIGALVSATELQGKGEHALLSHYSARTLAPLQRQLGARTEELIPGVLADHVQVHHSRGRTAPNGKAYGRENSTRSRSLLFIALGLALASVEGVPLWIPENGYASINPPLSSNRRGSLSTKTTHPAFFNGLRKILAEVGAHHDFSNPFAELTKGEMFARLRDQIDADAASGFLSVTTSCSHTGARTFHIPPKVQCGVCFGCVLRKSSFIAAGIEDKTPYLDPAGDAQKERWLAEKSVAIAMKDFLQTPLTESDLATLRIPADIALSDAADLCRRAMDELRGVSL